MVLLVPNLTELIRKFLSVLLATSCSAKQEHLLAASGESPGLRG